MGSSESLLLLPRLNRLPPKLYGRRLVRPNQSRRPGRLGGSNENGLPVDETWTWDGGTWTQLQPTTSPAARSAGRLAYDPTRDRLVLFGGFDGLWFDDTWVWNGETWALQDMRRSPTPRYAHSMSTLGRHVAVFAGRADPRKSSATWVLKRNGWRKLHAEVRPIARSYAAMEWDPVRREAVLFGGYHRGDLCDTWTLRP